MYLAPISFEDFVHLNQQQRDTFISQWQKNLND